MEQMVHKAPTVLKVIKVSKEQLVELDSKVVTDIKAQWVQAVQAV
jgi:hypothetical protein